MLSWLLIAAAAQAESAPGLSAGMKGISSVDIGHVATARALDLRLVQQSGSFGTVPLIRGMLVQREVGTNAAIGIGLANLYSRRKLGYDATSDGRPKRSRKPAVTFVMKF